MVIFLIFLFSEFSSTNPHELRLQEIFFILSDSLPVWAQIVKSYFGGKIEKILT